MSKVLFILIGPKGSGKSYIGSRIEHLIGVKFLRVEPLWLKLGEDEDGWQKVEKEIASFFLREDHLIIESLGVGDGFQCMYHSLKKKYFVKLIKVETDLNDCQRRVRSRDSVDHIPISDEKVQEYNRIAAKVVLPWDGVIDNNGPASDEEILAALSFLQKHNDESR